jgi:hypothetical protein
MKKNPVSWLSALLQSGLVVSLVLGALLAFPVYAAVSLWYGETKGPFKNWLQAVDLEGDGDLDVIVSHTRWEKVNLSWAGFGSLVNQGDRSFEHRQVSFPDNWPFAAGAGDVDRDGDPDIFAQDFRVMLMVNQGGVQAGKPGDYRSSGGINTPPAYDNGYRDMGGTVTLGDLNGDGWLDTFVAGCCYGVNAAEAADDFPTAPSLSWVWINDQGVRQLETGHILPLDFLDGQPVRQVALGDLDGDGDQDVFAAVGAPTLGTVDSQDDLILLNDGTGGLSAYDLPLGDTDSTSVALGDVNGDGRLDALVGTSRGANLWINQGNSMASGGPLFARADQSFAAARTIQDGLGRAFSAAAGRLLGLYLPLGSTRTHSVFLADLDGDKDLDAVLARLGGAEIWWNTGQGEFRRSGVRFPYREDTGLAVADFDGDGAQDILAGRNRQDYQVWWNDGSGGFIRGRR